MKHLVNRYNSLLDDNLLLEVLQDTAAILSVFF